MSREERDVENDVDWRAHHNALERQRRDNIKDSFAALRDAVPTIPGGKVSRPQILKAATKYIQTMERRNTLGRRDIEDLKRHNKLLDAQIRALEEIKAASAGSSPAASRSNAASTEVGPVSTVEDSCGFPGSRGSVDPDTSKPTAPGT
ncbi:hypothetical protein HPB48_008747 [Haemaphysalis longicornis]|uniref:BHLH domain-containing protein n=1 Tax=Haemaphysalis longicornis TaxID=44386 RepID=A0A9J6G5X1_HAELO|nr:hypothetical protein HPB48_008747 [Haemaphysalis longicornis]